MPAAASECTHSGARPCLQVVSALDELRHAVRWTEQSLVLDVDVRAHVFELTIRSLGGLLSAHSLLARDPSLVPGPPRNPLPVTLSESNATLRVDLRCRAL